MSLNDQLTEDLKQAMKAKDAVRLRTIRSLRAALKEKEIAERRDGEAHLSEEQVLAVVQKQAKQRRDAIAQYEPAGRDDLAAKEQEELEIIEAYLPKQLDDEEIRRVVQEVVASTGASSMRTASSVNPDRFHTSCPGVNATGMLPRRSMINGPTGICGDL